MKEIDWERREFLNDILNGIKVVITGGITGLLYKCGSALPKKPELKVDKVVKNLLVDGEIGNFRVKYFQGNGGFFSVLEEIVPDVIKMYDNKKRLIKTIKDYDRNGEIGSNPADILIEMVYQNDNKGRLTDKKERFYSGIGFTELVSMENGKRVNKKIKYLNPALTPFKVFSDSKERKEQLASWELVKAKLGNANWLYQNILKKINV